MVNKQEATKAQTTEGDENAFIDFCTQMLSKRMKIFESFSYEDINRFGNYLLSNPLILAACIVTILIFSIPLLVVCTCIIIYGIIALTGFVIISVSALAVTISVTSCVLFSTLTMLVFIGSCIFSIYYITKHIKQLLFEC